MQKDVLMISTNDTTEADHAAATKAEETRRDRAAHAAVIDGLQELTDFLADTGPAVGLTNQYTCATVGISLLQSIDGPIADRLGKLSQIAGVLGGVEIIRTETNRGTWLYRAERKFGEHVTYQAATFVDPAEVADAAAALAEAIEANAEEGAR